METLEEKKQKKAEYDRLYREKNKERLRIKKQAYCETEAGREMQKRQRNKRKEYHNEYCRKPEQRALEKINRHKREGVFGKTKYCIVCEKTKPVIDFFSWSNSKDGRSYICKECEKHHQKTLGCTTKNVITAIVMRDYTNLNRRDIVNHPYLIEANKYLILLKQLTK